MLNEDIIQEFNFFNINDEKTLKKEITDMIYLIVSSDYDTMEKIKNKIWTISEFWEEAKKLMQGDLDEGMFFCELIKCAKKLYNTLDIVEVLNNCHEELKNAFDEYEMQFIKNYNEIINMLEIIDDKIVFPKKWFSPEIYKKTSEFLKTFGCERKKIKNRVGFENKSEFTNEQILSIGKKINGVSLSEKFNFYPTPDELVKIAQELADVQPNDVILEPSAGTGNLLKGLNKDHIICIEINPICAAILNEKGYTTIQGSFDNFIIHESFADKILMNPPFANRMDAKHILKAFEFLKKGGALVAIHSVGIMTASDRHSKLFQALYSRYGKENIKVRAGMFENSGKGTNIQTMITKFVKE